MSSSLTQMLSARVIALVMLVLLAGILVSAANRLAAGAGWLTLFTLVMVGGLLYYAYQRYQAHVTACSINPRISPLQVACLAAMGVGVQLLHPSPEVTAALPLLRGWLLPYLFIGGGVLGLALYSLTCSCHDAALMQGMGEDQPNRPV